jgi:undecaprenyl-diphosphatase
MLGAFVWELHKNWSQMGGSNWAIVAVGFVVSFVAGWFVVKTLLDYVSHHGFGLFAWWRIVVGALGLIGLALLG